MLNLDEYVNIMAKPGVTHTIRPQCPFGASAFKSTSFLTFGVSLEDMSLDCCHSSKSWFRQGDASRINARHPPSRGRHFYYLTAEEALADTRTPKRFVASGLANYPKLLSTYLANKLLIALRSTPSSSTTTAPLLQHRWENRLGKEQVIFMEKLKRARRGRGLSR